MVSLSLTKNKIPKMLQKDIKRVMSIEEIVLSCPQEKITTTHTLHGGVYTRTILIKSGIILVGVLIKIPTTLIVSGDVTVSIGSKSERLIGYNIFAASANRKQAFIAHDDTVVTMIFKTKAKTVFDAEEEFTDDTHKLMSRDVDAANNYILTGE